jgi:hypothetical protein
MNRVPIARVGLVCLCAVLAVACGRGPTAPSRTSPPPTSFGNLPLQAVGADADLARCLAASGEAVCFSGRRLTASHAGGDPVTSSPINLTVSVSGSTVVLSWTQPPIQDSPVSSYIVEAGSSPGVVNLANFNTGNPATSLTVPGVPNGTYYVRVRAVNATGVSAASNEVVAIVGVGGCATVPDPPSGLTAIVSGSTVTLAWSGPAGGCAPTGYVLEAGSAPGFANLANGDVGNTLNFTASGVGVGTYYVRVRALNGAARSAPSNEVTVVVGSGGTTGQLVFWMDSDLGPLELNVNGTIMGRITQYHPSSTLACGTPGAITVTLPVGTDVRYSAQCVNRDPFTGQNMNIFLGLLYVPPGCTPIRFTSRVPCSPATAPPISFSGTVATTPTVPFGGPPYCSYTMSLANITSSLTVLGDTVTQAEVRAFAVENAVTSCGATTLIRPNTHVYRLAGARISGSAVSVDYTADGANDPRASLTFTGTLSPDRSFVAGTLAWHRIDQPSPLDWRVSTPITLGRRPSP